ncbi:unnamed protein product [Urochloa humidicola]
MMKLQAIEAALADAEDKRCAAEEELFIKLPDRVVSGSTFEEKSFGFTVQSDQEIYRDLSSFVVSLALFDGNKMIFACSGIPLPNKICRNSKLHLTRFVTSARLVEEFNKNRNKDDQLKVQVCLPDRTTVDGLLGLYDADIAIVTSIGLLHTHRVDLDLEEFVVSPDDTVLTTARAFNSGSLMTMDLSGLISHHAWVSDTQNFSEAALGGPLMVKALNGAVRFLGMNLRCTHYDANVEYRFLPQKLLHERLKHFQIINPKELHFREYSLPKDVSSIVPSGFVKCINRIKSLGYPMPPPLVLELNGRLLNEFEGYFGEVRVWKGYPFGDPPFGSEAHVWEHLSKKVVTNISRRVVALASFNGPSRFFACTGLLTKWHTHIFVLTSASLVRSRDHHDEVDNSLKIEVFLPPNQRVCGTLELYNLNYNFAIVSLEKNFKAICPEDIFNINPKASQVVAIGRDADEGLLMASIGEVKHRNKNTKLDCKDHKLSSCKINKAGIGGPLVDLDGCFVGMNFYDGSKVTPFIPKSKIVNALRGVKKFALPLERKNMLDGRGLSKRGAVVPIEIGDKGAPARNVRGRKSKNRWPVAEPYWYHGILDVDRYNVPDLIGRTLH